MATISENKNNYYLNLGENICENEQKKKFKLLNIGEYLPKIAEKKEKLIKHLQIFYGNLRIFVKLANICETLRKKIKLIKSWRIFAKICKKKKKMN